jgi:hypothetical protein
MIQKAHEMRNDQKERKIFDAIGKKRHYNKTDKHITLSYPFCHKAQGLSPARNIQEGFICKNGDSIRFFRQLCSTKPSRQMNDERKLC